MAVSKTRPLRRGKQRDSLHQCQCSVKTLDFHLGCFLRKLRSACKGLMEIMNCCHTSNILFTTRVESRRRAGELAPRHKLRLPPPPVQLLLLLQPAARSCTEWRLLSCDLSRHISATSMTWQCQRRVPCAEASKGTHCTNANVRLKHSIFI